MKFILKNVEKRKDIEETLKNSKKTLDIVRDLVYNMYISSYCFSINDFDSPSWAYKEAFIQGQRDSLETLLKLLDLQKEDDHLLTKTKRKALTDARRENSNSSN